MTPTDTDTGVAPPEAYDTTGTSTRVPSPTGHGIGHGVGGGVGLPHNVEWTIRVVDGAGRIDGHLVCDHTHDHPCPVLADFDCASIAEFYDGAPTHLRSGRIAIGWDRDHDCHIWSYAT